MYSEKLVADVLSYVQGTYRTGGDLDAEATRVVVDVGRIVGPTLGILPSDAALARHARTYGTPAPVGTRAAVHVLKGSRTALGLGSGRGVVETVGDRLVTVQAPEDGRYEGVYRLPEVNYGGLI